MGGEKAWRHIQGYKQDFLGGNSEVTARCRGLRITATKLRYQGMMYHDMADNTKRRL